MRPVYLFISLSAFLLAASITADAQVYKWTDEQGELHYADIEPVGVKNVKKPKLTSNVIDVEKIPFELKATAKKNPITLYSFSDCGEVCTRAQALLDKRGLPYTLKNTVQDKAELKRITGGNKVPLLIVGKQVPRVGFEESTWNRMLDEAGYPQTNRLASLNKKPPPAPVKTASALSPDTSPAVKPAVKPGVNPLQPTTLK